MIADSGVSDQWKDDESIPVLTAARLEGLQDAEKTEDHHFRR